MVEKKKPMAIVSYAMYRHLGALLPNTTDDTVRYSYVLCIWPLEHWPQQTQDVESLLV